MEIHGTIRFVLLDIRNSVENFETRNFEIENETHNSVYQINSSLFFFFFLFLSSASVPTFSAKGTLSINALEILYSREKRIFICEIVKPLFIF
jgi:hypothetical protein